MKLKLFITLSIASLFLMSGCVSNEVDRSSDRSSSERAVESRSSKSKESLSRDVRTQIDQSIEDAIDDSVSHRSVISESFSYHSSNKHFVKEVVQYYRKSLSDKTYTISDIDIEYVPDYRLVTISIVID